MLPQGEMEGNWGQTYTIAHDMRKMLLPGKKKQGPMEEIGPCRCKGDHLRIIAKSQW